MKILFVYSVNKRGSKTAEDYFAIKGIVHEFTNSSTKRENCRQEGTTELNEYFLQWAEVVYVMEKRHLNQIQKHTGSTYYSKIKELGIPDIYKYYNGDLIALLEEKVVF